MFRFESLDIWKLAIEYGVKLYDIADSLSQKEIYGLSSQLRRAVVSISNNIAEGSGANTNKDFSCFLDISVKSTLETVNILYFALYIRGHKTAAFRLRMERGRSVFRSGKPRALARGASFEEIY